MSYEPEPDEAFGADVFVSLELAEEDDDFTLFDEESQEHFSFGLSAFEVDPADLSLVFSAEEEAAFSFRDLSEGWLKRDLPYSVE